MKLALVLLAAAALATNCASGYKCYNCKSDNLQSNLTEYNTLKICEKDITRSETAEVVKFDMRQCLKIVEKIAVKGEEKELIIRTVGVYNQELPSDKYTQSVCNTDLCNSSYKTASATFSALVSAVVAAAMLLH